MATGPFKCNRDIREQTTKRGGNTDQAVLHSGKNHRALGTAPGFAFYSQCCHFLFTAFCTPFRNQPVRYRPETLHFCVLLSLNLLRKVAWINKVISLYPIICPSQSYLTGQCRRGSNITWLPLLNIYAFFFYFFFTFRGSAVSNKSELILFFLFLSVNIHLLLSYCCEEEMTELSWNENITFVTAKCWIITAVFSPVK